jgi:hypothetical protein
MDVAAFWTRDIDVLMEGQIMSCFTETFGDAKPANYFQWKFRDNPFGDSLHVTVSDGGKLVGSRVFWRLDVKGEEAYQCVDTAILPAYQRSGLFRKTTLEALKKLDGKFVYNYPNRLSGPAYIKSGWNVVKDTTSIKVNLTALMLANAPLIDWEFKALDWRFSQSPEASYYSYKRGRFYFIFSQRRAKYFTLLGKTRFKLDLKNADPVISFSYDNSSCGIPFYRKLPYMSKGLFKHELHTYLFDMA